jgi:hypothetical protein
MEAKLETQTKELEKFAQEKEVAIRREYQIQFEEQLEARMAELNARVQAREEEHRKEFDTMLRRSLVRICHNKSS